MKQLLKILLFTFFLTLPAQTLANPFLDVPTGHWAYHAVAQLAAAGLVEGYGDGSFIGNKTMSRYAMAQLVARAMAKQTQTDLAEQAKLNRLANEFSGELAGLGLQVASLEQKADKVKLRGEARILYQTFTGRYPGQVKSTRSSTRFRTRLWLTGQVNKHWQYAAMLETHHNLLSNSNSEPVYKGRKESEPALLRAWVQGRIGELEVTAGSFFYVPLYGTVIDEDNDGIKLKWHKQKWQLELFALRPVLGNDWLKPGNLPGASKNVQVYGGVAQHELAPGLHANLAYYQVDGKNAVVAKTLSIYEFALDYKVSKDFTFWAEYIRGDKPDAPSYDYFKRAGWVAGLKFGHKQRTRPGSFEVNAAYYNLPALATVVVTTKLNTAESGYGQKGYFLDGSVVLSKNIDLSFEYHSFRWQEKDLAGNRSKEKLLWTFLRFYF